MSADYPLKEIELNRLTNEVLAKLPQFRIIDKVTVIRACQHMAFVTHPELRYRHTRSSRVPRPPIPVLCPTPGQYR